MNDISTTKTQLDLQNFQQRSDQRKRTQQVNVPLNLCALRHIFLDGVGEVVDVVSEVGFGFVHLLDFAECVDNG